MVVYGLNSPTAHDEAFILVDYPEDLILEPNVEEQGMYTDVATIKQMYSQKSPEERAKMKTDLMRLLANLRATSS